MTVPVEGGGYDPRSWTATDEAPGVAWLDIPTMVAGIEAARREADLVVVLLHFGLEWQLEPGEAQREQARAAIDAGATLVVGAHPHVLQEVEAYGDGLIAYSLGNFVFDGFWDPANDSAILLVELTAAGVAAWEMVPGQHRRRHSAPRGGRAKAAPEPSRIVKVMRYRLAAFDIDGTLVGPSGKALAGDHRGGRVAGREWGVLVAVATARPYELAMPTLAPLAGAITAVIAAAGADIRRGDGEPIAQTPLPAAAARAIAELCDAQDWRVVTGTAAGAFRRLPTPEALGTRRHGRQPDRHRPRQGLRHRTVHESRRPRLRRP